ncbi:MAG TPA: MASE1 domain-containing protein [Marinobacter sp.]|nr:MASE1 domain-containing protein [Marinobacter sp.]
MEGLPISIIWPASGLMLGAGVVLGYPIVLFSAIVLAVWLATLQGTGLSTALFMATAQGLGVVAALIYLRRNAGSQTALQLETRERLVYLRAGTLTATVTAGMGAAGMVLAGVDLTYSAHDIFLVYWLLEALSILLFAPLAYYFYLNPLRFTDALRRDLASRQMTLWYSAAVVLAIAVWALPELADRTYAVALSFAFFPLLCCFSPAWCC